jgi:hypothetical protein
MAHKNPWFLITLDEIAGIQDQLQSIQQDLPGQHQDTVEGIAMILSNVRDRMP